MINAAHLLAYQLEVQKARGVQHKMGLQSVVRGAFLHQCDLQALADVLTRQRGVPAKQHLEPIQGCSRVSGEPAVKEFLQQSTLTSCGPRLVLVLQQLLRTQLAHHDQHVAQLSTESLRVGMLRIAPTFLVFKRLSMEPQ